MLACFVLNRHHATLAFDAITPDSQPLDQRAVVNAQGAGDLARAPTPSHLLHDVVLHRHAKALLYHGEPGLRPTALRFNPHGDESCLYSPYTTSQPAHYTPRGESVKGLA
jgi:hypothetical protein